MVFSSTIFLFFFLPFTLVVYFCLPHKTTTVRNNFLFIMSLLFYAWGEPRFIFVLLFVIIVNYFLAFYAERARRGEVSRKMVMLLTAVINLSVLFIFKYLNFAVENINYLVRKEVLPQTEIVLPIGISFMTFQAMSYTFDVLNGDGVLQKNPFNVGLYVSLFPQLIAGPIVRYQTVANEIGKRRVRIEDFSYGVRRFLLGLGKKVIIANAVAKVADEAFGATQAELRPCLAWIGAIAYTLQIYYDFSGYSDMAIGMGRMFGFHFLENFNYPYISKTVTEFWRRWHISLGTWFRDYVYIPLGGSRKGTKKTVRNLLIVWMLTGIWHGANWTFIIWGAYYFLCLWIEKALHIPQKIAHGKMKWYRAMTFLLVVFGWVLFRADTLTHAAQYLQVMFRVQPWTAADTFVLTRNLPLFAVGTFFALPLIPALGKKLSATSNNWRLAIEVLQLLFVGIVGAMAVICVISTTYNPFIYFNF